MRTHISKEEKAYLLQLARKYEKGGFRYNAAGIYRNVDRAKAMRIYTSLAKNAESKGFLIIAADLYRSAGKEDKCTKLIKRAAADLARKGFSRLSKEVARLVEPEDPKHTEMRKLNLSAWGSLKKGDLEKARREFLRGAKFAEKKGFYDMSMSLYFHAGDRKSAERMRKLAKQKGLLP